MSRAIRDPKVYTLSDRGGFWRIVDPLNAPSESRKVTALWADRQYQFYRDEALEAAIAVALRWDVVRDGDRLYCDLCGHPSHRVALTDGGEGVTCIACLRSAPG